MCVSKRDKTFLIRSTLSVNVVYHVPIYHGFFHHSFIVYCAVSSKCRAILFVLRRIYRGKSVVTFYRHRLLNIPMLRKISRPQVRQIWKDIRDVWSVLKNGAEREIMRKYSYTGKVCTTVLLRMKIIYKKNRTRAQSAAYLLHMYSALISYQYINHCISGQMRLNTREKEIELGHT